jgi:hypothetical protein
MSRKPRRRQRRKSWQPLRGVEFDPDVLARLAATGDPPQQVWVNDTYQVLVRFLEGGFVRLGIHRFDRKPVRDWRHLQAIKNEVCGTERWAVEIFPAESSLVDTSMEYHLLVYPEGESPPHSLGHGWAVASSGAANEARVRGTGKGRQRPWQPGLPTGLGLLEHITDPDVREAAERASKHLDENVRKNA